jgi:hypothetical protein
MMTRYTIEVSETIYNLLHEQATIQNNTLEEVIERLLISTSFVWQEDKGGLISLLPQSEPDSLAAVQRLTTLFADTEIPNLEEVLNDPMIELTNAELNLDLM